MLRRGIHRNVNNPLQTAKFNSYCGDPTQWFHSDFFKGNHLFCIDFDFFVNWNHNTIASKLWTKRIICRDFPITEHEIYRQILAADGDEYVHNIVGFSNRYGFDLEYLLFHDIKPDEWKDPNNKIYIFNITNYLKHKTGSNVLIQVSADELKKIIYQLRQQCHGIGKKGLRFASSSLEVYLSRDRYIYPGDADIVLIDENYKAIAIFEVKKHNIYSQKQAKKIADETIYHYRDTDVLKYQSLGLLKDFLHCPLYMLFYTTIDGESQDAEALKFERIVGMPQKLQAVYPKMMRLPQQNCITSLQAFQEAFLHYHTSECVFDFDTICLTDSYQKGTPIARASGKMLKYILDPRNSAPEKQAIEQYIKFIGTHLREI